MKPSAQKSDEASIDSSEPAELSSDTSQSHYSGQTNEKGNKDEEEIHQLLAKETHNIRYWKAAVIILLCTITFVVTHFTFVFFTLLQEEDFEETVRAD